MKRMSLLFVLTATLVGCGQTKMLSSWKAPDFQGGPFRKTLVIGVFERAGVREVVEGQFVELLKQENVDAAASNAFLTDEELSREAVVQKVSEVGFDSVVLARLIGEDDYQKAYSAATKTLDVDQARQQTWYHDYTQSTTPQQVGSYTVASQRDVRVETRVFDARTQKLVWSGVSETHVDGQDASQIQSAASAILASMRKEKVF